MQTKGLAMGSRLSGVLATLVMDDLERATLTADLAIGIYRRYVDDIFVLTTDANEANKIFSRFNSSHADLKFDIEMPENGKLALLDFQIEVVNGRPVFGFYKKPAKKNVFVHWQSSIPTSQKYNIITNEFQRIRQRCSTSIGEQNAVKQFKTDLLNRGYSENAVQKCEQKARQIGDQEPIRNTPRHWLKFPFVSERVDRQLKKAINRSGFKIGIQRRSKTLKGSLSNPQTVQCRRDCGIIACEKQNTVYMFKCECGAEYCGSSKRSLHKRAEEHLTGSRGPTAVTEHRAHCPQADIGQFHIEDRGRDVVDTRLKEAIIIARKRPILNRADELGRWIESLP